MNRSSHREDGSPSPPPARVHAGLPDGYGEREAGRGEGHIPVFVPFSISDFLDRAVTVYADRTGVVDETDQPAPSVGELTYGEMAALARRPAAKLDELGVLPGDRVAIVSAASPPRRPRRRTPTRPPPHEKRRPPA
jgi:non-ribosomal peptide synthetase component F